jgi:hypothetical protein
MGRNDLLHFPTCKKYAEEEDIVFVEYTKITDQLSSEFNYGFQDFESFQPDITLFNNPLTCDIESQPGHLQLEICELQYAPSINTFQATAVNFWKLLSPESISHCCVTGL